MFTVGLFAVVAVLVAAGVWVLRHGRMVSSAVAAFDRTALAAPGRVVDVETEEAVHLRSETGVPQDVYFPVVEYVLPEGRMLRSRTMNGSRPAPAKVGDDVTVLYDPDDPTRVELGGRRMRHWYGTIYSVLAFGFFAMALLAVGVWVLLKVVLDVPV